MLFLEPLRGYRGIRDLVPDEEHSIPIGEAKLVKKGDDVVIISWSYQVELSKRVAESLEEDGISAAVLDLRSIVPLDIESLTQIVTHCGRAVVVQEAPETAGFASEIIATINDECFWSLEAPVVRVSGFDVPYPVGMLENLYVPDEERIRSAVLRVMEKD